MIIDCHAVSLKGIFKKLVIQLTNAQVTEHLYLSSVPQLTNSSDSQRSQYSHSYSLATTQTINASYEKDQTGVIVKQYCYRLCFDESVRV